MEIVDLKFADVEVKLGPAIVQNSEEARRNLDLGWEDDVRQAGQVPNKVDDRITSPSTMRG